MGRHPRCHGRTVPSRSALPRFALPDGHRALEGVDAVVGGFERLEPVGGRDHHQDAGLPHLQTPRAVDQRQSADRRPRPAGRRGHRQPRHRLPVKTSYSSDVTPGRPSEWSRTTPQKVTTAPQSGRVAQATARSTESGWSVTSIQSFVSSSGGGTRDPLPGWPGDQSSGPTPGRAPILGTDPVGARSTDGVR